MNEILPTVKIPQSDPILKIERIDIVSYPIRSKVPSQKTVFGYKNRMRRSDASDG
jgi:hypothetical protein